MEIELSGRNGFGLKTIVDDWVWEEIKNRLGYVPSISATSGDYIYAQISWEGKTKRLHHVVWQIHCEKNGLEYPKFSASYDADDWNKAPTINHKYYNKLDNRISELEVLTHEENSFDANTTREYDIKPRGGCITKRSDRKNGWVAQIQYKGKRLTKKSIDKAKLEHWLSQMQLKIMGDLST